MKQDETLQTLRADIKEAFDTPKCKKGGCLRDTMIALREETASLKGEEADALREDIARFLEGMEPIQYECLGCDPCYPAVAENRFHSVAEGVLPLIQINRPSCSFDLDVTRGFPPVAGEYIILDPHSPVAVSTLASVEMPQQLAHLKPQGLCITGKTETENIGIDKVVKNIASNPCIRFLIVAGLEPKGHLSGRTLLALAASGVDERMRVIGSPARRPFLRNIALEDVEQFRRQVQVVDLIGCTDVEQIASEAERLAEQAPCRCHHVATPYPAAQPSVPHIRATPPQKLKLDKAGYFVILPQPDKGILLAEHYDYQDRLLHVIEGEDARTICATIIEMGLVSQMDHAAYLGRELMRAELSLHLGFPFIQEGAG